MEQASLAQATVKGHLTRFLAWYNLAGSFATALGALVSGSVAQLLHSSGMPLTASYRVLIVAYAGLGAVLALIAACLSSAVEAAIPGDPGTTLKARFGLHQSRGIVLKLSSLFVLDAFAGGLVVQSLVAYWFHLRFGLEPGLIGIITFGANILAGISALAAVRIAKRFGLVNTMVFTHLPSNILLILVPLMPTLPLTLLVFLLRFSISQMDVPTRQAYLMAVVTPGERSAAGGVANMARTIGSSASPILAGVLLGSTSMLGGIFILSGSLKILYDLLLLRGFYSVRVDDV